MTTRLSLASLGLACWLTASSFAADKVEVLARGPVHEGYAEPSEREPVASPIIPNEPPKAIEELPPDQKPEGDNIQWIPGYWGWDEEKKDFLWVSGFWRNAPPGRSWVPGSWRKAAEGWQWSGGFWAGVKEDKAEVEYLPKPPAPLDNAGPTTPAPSEKHVYVPGTWVYRDRYVWRPGFWSEHRAGWVWTSAHYRWTPAGYVFIDGYWDYPLADRGMLFAPAYIPATVYMAPTYVYTPTVIVREECLYGAFFARRGYGSYYFGDYFAPSYASVGFVAWSGHVSASITLGGFYDPLFSYYRCGYRSDPYWGVGIGNLYVGRFRGDYMRPPTTFVQQNTVINNITNNNTTINKTNLNNVTMLTSLNDAGRDGRRNLQTVSAADRQSELEAARRVRETGNRRATTEAELAARPGSGAGSKLTTPRSAKLDVATRTPSPKSGLAPSTSDPKTASLVNPKGPSVSPPSPKATALGKVDPAPGAGTTRPPVTPKTGTALNTPGTLTTPKAGIDPTSPKVNPPAAKTPTNPAPAANTPVTPPRTTTPSSGGPATPKSVAPPASSPKPVSPPAKPAPKATPKSNTSASPPVAAFSQPAVARAAAPSVQQYSFPSTQSPVASRPSPAMARSVPSVSRPTPSVSRPAAASLGRPTAAASKPAASRKR